MNKSSKIAGNSARKCLKCVSKPYMTSTLNLMHFWKNRKKSILNFFFDDASTKFPENRFSRKISAKYDWGSNKHTLGPPRKKSPNNSILFNSYQKKSNLDHFWQKSIFLHLGRFGYKKASKIKKFLIFEFSKISAFSGYIHCWGYS